MLALPFLFLFGYSCTSANDSSNVQAIQGSVVDYSNGVYYFDEVQANLGNALSAFVKAHPELEITAVTGDGTAAYGADTGYFVVTRPTTPCDK